MLQFSTCQRTFPFKMTKRINGFIFLQRQWLYQDDPHQILSHRLSQPSSDSSQPAISNIKNYHKCLSSNTVINIRTKWAFNNENLKKLINSLTLKLGNQNHDGVWTSDLNKQRFLQLILFLLHLTFYFSLVSISIHLRVCQIYSAICRIFVLFSRFANVVRHSLLYLWYS